GFLFGQPFLRHLYLASHIKNSFWECMLMYVISCHPGGSKPCALCVVSEDLLLCTDDAQGIIHQLSLEFDGVTIRGNTVSVISFTDGMLNIESIYFLDKYAYIAASSCHGGLYRCELSTNVVEKVHSNSAEGARSATGVNRICSFKGNVVFTDSKAGRVKQYNPVDGSVSILLGSGLDRSQDGTDKTCSFAQVKGITLENTLFVTDVSAGAIKLVTGLAGTITFLKMLGCLYESFGIHSKVSKGMSVGNASSLENVKENVAKVNKYVQDTVTKVKEHYHMKESSVTNGPEGTISHQTQTSLDLLNKGINRLCKNLTDINPRFADDVALESLLTTQVENLHAVSHFKHEIFSVLQYAQDFDTIVKESLKRTTKWAAKYYTHVTSRISQFQRQPCPLMP
ncbi:Hypothetical predicted protein, partial [Paramuricea clavata]